MSTGTNSNFPKARTADLITERVGDELVVYDGKSSEAHCLSALAAAVFVAADGKTSTADLAAIAGRQLQRTVDVPEVEQALAELEDRDLVEPTEVGGISRRGFMQRSAAVGGAVMAGSLVTSVVTPAYGTTGSLPQGVPCTGFSSLAIQIEKMSASAPGNTDPVGTLYTAQWGPSASGTPSWTKIGEANANCPTTGAWSSTSGSISSGVSLSDISGGVCITIPAGYTILQWAAWFGKGAVGSCKTQQCVTGHNPTPAPSGCYPITFNSTCYQGC